MDQKSQEYFDKILTKDPEQLNDFEIGFLRARREYLKKSQAQEYDSVLNPKKEEVKEENQTSEKSEPVKDDATKQTN